MTSVTGAIGNVISPILGRNDVLNVPGIQDVVSDSASRYTGVMPRQKNPDELTASAAVELLGTYRQYFYNLIKEGRIKPHYRRSSGKRAYYLRSEVLALKAQLDAEDAADDAQQSAPQSAPQSDTPEQTQEQTQEPH